MKNIGGIHLRHWIHPPRKDDVLRRSERKGYKGTRRNVCTIAVVMTTSERKRDRNEQTFRLFSKRLTEPQQRLQIMAICRDRLSRSVAPFLRCWGKLSGPTQTSQKPVANNENRRRTEPRNDITPLLLMS
ncbi:hypothetical protein Trydic_g23833 [Trypoxylus dichotomus]